MRPALTILPVLLLVHLSALAAAAQTRVTVTNVPGGVSLQAVLNAANDSKPMTPAGTSGTTVSFSMLADAANLGKPVAVYLLREEDDDDRPAGIYFVIDNGAVPPRARRIGSFTLTARTTEVVIDYRTGQVTVHEGSGGSGTSGSPFPGRFEIGLYTSAFHLPNADGDGDVCTAPAGSTLTNCDLGKWGTGYRIELAYDFMKQIGVSFNYADGGGATLDRTIQNNANANLTATQKFDMDLKSYEFAGRFHHDANPRVRLSLRAGLAYTSADSTNTFTTLLNGNPLVTQSDTTKSSSWSPLVGAGITAQIIGRFGIGAHYGWMRLKDGDVDTAINRFDVGVAIDLGPVHTP
jgi:opacity protein-like surface antigen